jgi:hypothetical protein
MVTETLTRPGEMATHAVATFKDQWSIYQFLVATVTSYNAS